MLNKFIEISAPRIPFCPLVSLEVLPIGVVAGIPSFCCKLSFSTKGGTVLGGNSFIFSSIESQSHGPLGLLQPVELCLDRSLYPPPSASSQPEEAKSLAWAGPWPVTLWLRI